MPEHQSGAALAAPTQRDLPASTSRRTRSVAQTAEQRHPDLFHALAHEAWQREFDTLIARLDSLQHHKVALELARIVARVQDGHTRLTLPLGPGIDFVQGHSPTPKPHLDALQFHQYPLRLAIDARGVYVQRAPAEHRSLLGAYVVRLGRLDIRDAIDAVSPLIHRDNGMQVRHHLPMYLVLAEVLHARGVTETMETLRIAAERPDGSVVRADMHVIRPGTAVDWVDARDDATSPTPLYLQHPERKFWFAHLGDQRAVYLQFNEVYDEPDERLRDFAQRLATFLDEHEVDNLIVDLRHNRGGNQRLARPLLHAIVSSRVNHTGHLLALIGRTTFSAAMTFSLQLEKHTRVLFVGEPTGSTPNHYGDARKTRLPHTGLTLRVSTRYWQHHPTDVRRWIAPHIPVEPTADDYQHNRDPLVDTVLEMITARQEQAGAHAAKSVDARGRTGASGLWSGYTSPGENSFALEISVGGPDTAPRVRVRLPALAVDTTGVQARLEEGALHFEVRWQDEPVVFRGRVAGDWWVGEGDYGSVFFPFVLRRQPPPVAAGRRSN